MENDHSKLHEWKILRAFQHSLCLCMFILGDTNKKRHTNPLITLFELDSAPAGTHSIHEGGGRII